MGVAKKPSTNDTHVTMEKPTMFFKNVCLVRSMCVAGRARAPFLRLWSRGLLGGLAFARYGYGKGGFRAGGQGDGPAKFLQRAAHDA